MTTITKIKSYQRDVKQLRVAAYCRVSTDNIEQLESLENQREHYQKYISSHPNWDLYKVYYDEGISGTKLTKRDALNELLADCRNHRIDLVVTKSISRLSRNTTDCLQIVRELQQLNIPIIFKKEHINTGSMASELFLSILSSIAQDESHSTAGNLRWSFRQRFASGQFKVSSAPYGYSVADGNLIINQFEARIVQEIFRRFLGRASASSIAKGLNQRQVPTQRGGQWHSSTVINILRNSNYTGDMLCQKTYRDEQYHRHFNQGELPQYLIEDHHPSLVNREIFNRVQALLKEAVEKRHIEIGSHKYQQHYLFSGMINCGHCGTTFKRQTRPNKIYWACQRHLRSAKQCPVKAITEVSLEAAFCNMMNKGIMPQYYVENDHPAIIPKSVFMQVQQIIKQRRNGIVTKNGKHRRINGKYCFSQKVFCGKCGDILQRNMWYRPEKVAVWRCASRVRRSKTGRRCMIRNVKKPLLKEATVEAFNKLIEGHELASKQIKANIMHVIKDSQGPTLDQLDKQLEEVQMKLIQAANQHQDCNALTQQIMDLRKQKEKVQSRETNQQVKLHSLEEINELVEFHKYGLVDFDEGLVRRLIEKITIYQRYMEFTFKDGEVIRINM